MTTLSVPPATEEYVELTTVPRRHPLHRTDLVVGVHDGDEDGVVAERSDDVRGVDPAVGVDGDEVDLDRKSTRLNSSHRT